MLLHGPVNQAQRMSIPSIDGNYNPSQLSVSMPLSISLPRKCIKVVGLPYISTQYYSEWNLNGMFGCIMADPRI